MQRSDIVTGARDLQVRSDKLGLTQAALHAAFLLGGVAALSLLPQPWWTAAFLIYSITLVFVFAPLHEAIHRTAFRSRWLNDCCAHLCGFLLLLPPRYFRCFHLAHHRHTQIPGLDPELLDPGPKNLADYIWRLSGLTYWRERIHTIARHAQGRIDEAFIEPARRRAVIREARVYAAGYGTAALLAITGPGEVLPIYWWLPALCGMPALRAYLMAEHTGCEPGPAMHRNSRTLHSNRLLRALAWNMPYHTAHHSQPAVPFHALPHLHARLQPAPLVQSRGYIQFHCELIARLRRGDTPVAG